MSGSALAGTASSLPNVPKPPRRMTHWVSWALGVALLGGVVFAALHFSQAEEFLRIGREAQPGWMALAFGLQALTYSAQGEVFCLVGRRAGSPVRRWFAYRLSLAKIFVDQAIPSGGLSGTALIASALERGGMPRPAVSAALAVDHASYYAAYVMCLGAAIALLDGAGMASAPVIALSIAFCLFGAAFGVSFLVLAGRAPSRSAWLSRVRPLKAALDYLAAADRALAWNGPVLVGSTSCQIAIVLLDASTTWVCIAALGPIASPGGVFASFMVSSLLRTLGVVPGGLGTYEAASVLTLRAAGVSIPVALSATLLFRGLSFWLPLVPGVWLSRLAASGGASHERRG